MSVPSNFTGPSHRDILFSEEGQKRLFAGSSFSFFILFYIMGAQRAFAPSSLFCRVNSRVKIKERVFFLINLDSVSHEDSTNSKFKTFSQINKIVKVKYHMNIQILCCPFLFFGFEMVLHLHQMIEWA